MSNSKISAFDPIYWANINNDIEKNREAVNATVQVLVNQHIDITNDYNRWLNIGFALAQTFGEEGRDLFHRLSQFNAGYDYAEADKKYSECLRTNRGDVSYKTILHYAQEMGVDLSRIARECVNTSRAEAGESAKSAKLPSVNSISKTPKNTNFSVFDNEMADDTLAQLALTRGIGYTFSDKIDPNNLPLILRKVYESMPDAASRDKMILGSLVIISGIMGGANGSPECRSGVYGVYDNRRVFAPFNVICYGDAATKKGEMLACKKLANGVKNEMRRKYEYEKSQYESEMMEWEASNKGNKKTLRGPQPQEPDFLDPFAAANSSTAAIYQTLNANGGWAIMFETELDTLSSMLEKDYGNYSDLLRRAHHHEPLTENRKTGKSHIEIEEPRIAILLTCTPGQIPALLPSFENGLGSRFLFYGLPTYKMEFRNVFARRDVLLEDTYKELGDELLPLFHAMQQRADHPIQFVLSRQQEQMFVEAYQETLSDQFQMLGEGITSFIYRNALECFRIAMILTTLRALDRWDKQKSIFDEAENALVCSDEDYQTALTIMMCLLSHTARVYSVLAKDDDNPFMVKGINLKEHEVSVYNALPNDEFRTNEFLDLAMPFAGSKRSAYRMLNDFTNKYCILSAVSHGKYRKIAPNEA